MQFVTVIDACPSDRLAGGDDIWHTLAILQAGSWQGLDGFITTLKMSLRAEGLQLRKWGGIASSTRREAQNLKFRKGFLAALRTSLPNSRVSLLTVSCQERTMIAAEKTLCEELGMECLLVIADRPSVSLRGYTKHRYKGNEVVTLGPFEKISPDGRSELISNPITVRQDNAVVWLWMAHALWSLYKSIESEYQRKPVWSVHFDRLANDDAAKNYPGLEFIDLLLKARTTMELTASYAEGVENASHVSTPDLIVDCIAGWVNAGVSNGLTTTSLAELLGEECKDHLGLHVVSDVSDLVALRSNFTSQPTP